MKRMIDGCAIINTCDWGSTGKIARGLHIYLLNNGIDSIFCYGRGKRNSSKDCYRICGKLSLLLSFLIGRITGKTNFSFRYQTRKLISKLRQREVRNVFLINLQGYYLNNVAFWDYLINDKINVVYIMADEYAFGGNCDYVNGCRDKSGVCNNCVKQRYLQKIIFPNVPSQVYLDKHRAYSRMEHIVFVGPEFVVSRALMFNLLKNKETAIVDEAIDLKRFFPRNPLPLREKLGIQAEKIIIGCVAPFSYKRKGVSYLIDAARKLEDDNRFVFVQVGYDSKDKSQLPHNYVAIDFVKDQDLLAVYYSMADLFVFPSVNDTMPNACLEALACGSPLLCFNISGMPYIADATVMTLVEPRNVSQMVDVIRQTPKKTQDIIKKCRLYAEKRYDNQNYFGKLLNIMKELNNI